MVTAEAVALVAVVAGALACGAAAAAAGTPPAPQAEWLQRRLEWFQDQRFGLFVHWGIYSQWGCIESWPLVEVDQWARPDDLACWVERGKDMERFKRDYFALNRTFNPRRFDPGRWADLARRAGMKYMVFTTKHHDGFSMFDTRQTDFRVTHADCPYSRQPQPDIARAVFDAFRARGFGIGVYFSKSDWHSPYYWDGDRPDIAPLPARLGPQNDPGARLMPRDKFGRLAFDKRPATPYHGPFRHPNPSRKGVSQWPNATTRRRTWRTARAPTCRAIGAACAACAWRITATTGSCPGVCSRRRPRRRTTAAPGNMSRS